MFSCCFSALFRPFCLCILLGEFCSIFGFFLFFRDLAFLYLLVFITTVSFSRLITSLSFSSGSPNSDNLSYLYRGFRDALQSVPESLCHSVQICIVYRYKLTDWSASVSSYSDRKHPAHYPCSNRRHSNLIYYALLQIGITICNPPSLTAGWHCVPLSASFIRPLPKPLCGFGGCCAACKAQRVVLCNRGQYIKRPCNIFTVLAADALCPCRDRDLIHNLQVINHNRRFQDLMLNKFNNYIFAVRKYQYITGTKLCDSRPAKLVDIERVGRC